MPRPADRRFPHHAHQKLDAAERRAAQPPERVVEALALEPDHTVVDVGAGTGFFALPLAAALPAGRVVAVDVSPEMLERLAERSEAAGLGGRIELVEGDADGLHLGERRAHRVLLANMIHEVDDPEALVATLAAVLVPGGRLLVVDWDPAGNADRGPAVEHRIPVERVEAAMAAAGFTGTRRLDLYADFYAVEGRIPG